MPSPPINVELIRSRAADIRRELLALQRYAGLREDTFASDPEKIRAARYSLVVVVEAAAAVCNHLSARLGRVPDSYPACFELLGELGVLESGLAQRLAAMARLRNLLVHAYGRVDDRRFHRTLREDLGDVEAYLLAVDRYVKSASTEGQ